jgi:hypothetical protein
MLYCMGLFAALPASLAFPAFDIIYGWWANEVTRPGVSQTQLRDRGAEAGWLMATIGMVTLVSTWAFLTCCKRYETL